MLSSGPSGFYNAPVSKAIFITVGLNSLICAVLNARHSFHLQLFPHVVTHHQFWRLLTTHFVFSNSSEILFGSLLLYHFRLLERQWGSRKYAAFALVTSAVATGFAIPALWLGKGIGVSRIAAGPYGLVFAALWQYHRDVPVTVRVRILGFGLSDKVFLYILSAQLLWSSFTASLTAGLCGALAGFAYRASPSLRSWRFPASLTRFCQTYLEPLLASPPTSAAGAIGTGGRSVGRGGRGMGGLFDATAVAADGAGGAAAEGLRRRRDPVPQMSEEEGVALLVGMGFEQERALAELRRAGGDVERAATRLVE
ncbi:hypothetical protein DFJ73DRAFT_812526 [Zopfochytrium polystomum]|nr:hypothetical protein DFJ73DRAFT_812526 [Zopfochytrium polystomum]